MPSSLAKPNLIAPIMLAGPGSWRMWTSVVPAATAFQSIEAGSTTVAWLVQSDATW